MDGSSGPGSPTGWWPPTPRSRSGCEFWWSRGSVPSSPAPDLSRVRRQDPVGTPSLKPEEVRREASRYVAPIEVAPHVAGAAVDLSLIDLDGRRLDMGTLLDARAFDAVAISAEARANRRLLSDVLTGAGLVNYPTEWWHWSYGDRYWAFETGAASACYGTVPSEWTP